MVCGRENTAVKEWAIVSAWCGKGRRLDSAEEWFVLGITLPEVCEVLGSKLDPTERGLWSVCKSEGCVKGSLRLHISMASEGTRLQ